LGTPPTPGAVNFPPGVQNKKISPKGIILEEYGPTPLGPPFKTRVIPGGPSRWFQGSEKSDTWG